MYLFNQETLLINDSDKEILKKELKNRKIQFWKSLGLIIIISPVAPLLSWRSHPIFNNFNDYKNLAIQISLFTFSITILLYSWFIYRIKKDLNDQTKIRFKTIIQKTKEDSEIYQKGVKYCDILLNPIEKSQEVEKPKGLLYYLKKNIFPPKKITIPIPVNIYPSLKEGEGMIEISTYSKTFLSFRNFS